MLLRGTLWTGDSPGLIPVVADGKVRPTYGSTTYGNVVFLKCIPLVLDICGSDGGASHWCDYGNGEFDVKLLCLAAKNVVQLKMLTRGYLVMPGHFWHGQAAL